MTDIFTPAEIRVLGSLIEKEITTPESYPLSLNALMNACNQTSSRDPVMTLREEDVAAAVEALRKRGLVRAVQTSGARVMKYRHLATEIWDTTPAETAALGVLMLRGPQTAGEIRTRAQRLFDFDSIPAVEAALQSLMNRTIPFVERLPREPGRKEARYAQTLGGETQGQRPGDIEEGGRMEGDEDRLAALEAVVEELRSEVVSLREQMEVFRRQFE